MDICEKSLTRQACECLTWVMTSLKKLEVEKQVCQNLHGLEELHVVGWTSCLGGDYNPQEAFVSPDAFGCWTLKSRIKMV